MKLFRGLTTSQKKEVLQQAEVYGTTSSKMAEALGVNSKMVRNLIDHVNKKKQLSKDHFTAFKMELQELMKKSSDLHVIIPQGSVNSMELNRFSVLLLSKSLISYVVG